MIAASMAKACKGETLAPPGVSIAMGVRTNCWPPTIPSRACTTRISPQPAAHATVSNLTRAAGYVRKWWRLTSRAFTGMRLQPVPGRPPFAPTATARTRFSMLRIRSRRSSSSTWRPLAVNATIRFRGNIDRAFTAPPWPGQIGRRRFAPIATVFTRSRRITTPILRLQRKTSRRPSRNHLLGQLSRLSFAPRVASGGQLRQLPRHAQHLPFE
jgi:hypothetical protein